MPRMSETLPDLLLIGCGKMGGAMLSGWLERGLSRAVVVEPFAQSAAAFAGRATVVPDAAAIPADFRPGAVIFAIKPQEAPATLPAYARFAIGDTLFVSIMAGRSVATPVAGKRSSTVIHSERPLMASSAWLVEDSSIERSLKTSTTSPL